MKSEKVVALPFIRERSDKLGHNHCFGKSKNAKKHRKLRRKKTFQKKTKMPRAYVRAYVLGAGCWVLGIVKKPVFLVEGGFNFGNNGVNFTHKTGGGLLTIRGFKMVVTPKLIH